MTELPLSPEDGGGRFPGFDVMAQSEYWDGATQAVVGSRLGLLPDVRFFTPQEEATASALFDQLLDQREEPRVPVVNMVDQRLAEQHTDGWHYDDLPADADAWRQSLAGLDKDATDRHGASFAGCTWDQQRDIIDSVQRRGPASWHGLPSARIWSLWTRYACTAFYSHPWAWNEIGFAGPAYPRGYKNMGVDRREPFEVADARPDDDPTEHRSRLAPQSPGAPS
jgi:hypothetical protein